MCIRDRRERERERIFSFILYIIHSTASKITTLSSRNQHFTSEYFTHHKQTTANTPERDLLPQNWQSHPLTNRWLGKPAARAVRPRLFHEPHRKAGPPKLTHRKLWSDRGMSCKAFSGNRGGWIVRVESWNCCEDGQNVWIDETGEYGHSKDSVLWIANVRCFCYYYSLKKLCLFQGAKLQRYDIQSSVFFF